MIHVMLAALGMLVAKSNAGTSPLGIAALVFVCLGALWGFRSTTSSGVDNVPSRVRK